MICPLYQVTSPSVLKACCTLLPTITGISSFVLRPAAHNEFSTRHVMFCLSSCTDCQVNSPLANVFLKTNKRLDRQLFGETQTSRTTVKILVEQFCPSESVLGRARLRTLRNVYGVGSPTVGPTSSSVRLHIYVPSHI